MWFDTIRNQMDDNLGRYPTTIDLMHSLLAAENLANHCASKLLDWYWMVVLYYLISKAKLYGK
ncbi:hypothetical protein DA717_13610 [Piscirickettsiaceae bacterium NZ-RLO2]|nr:hypothetical protein DA717_13610 [Piscirickettsiaceae bacterium NZ-RLO2]